MTLTNGQRTRADGPFQRMAAKFRSQPLPGRWATAGAGCLGVLGAVVGLVVGLIVHTATAPVAVFELGLPAAVVGGATGFLGGMIVVAVRRLRADIPDDRN